VIVVRKQLDAMITHRITGSPLASLLLIRGIMTITIAYGIVVLQPMIKFIWACFIRPIGKADQTQRLNRVIAFPFLEHVLPYLTWNSFMKAKLRYTTRRGMVYFVAGKPCSHYAHPTSK
jgi:hypothetical protein